MGEREAQVKTCTACREVKPVIAFNRNKSRKDGRSSICKVCKRKTDAEYRARNPNKNKEDYAKRIAENPNYWAEWYASNREDALARVSKWQKENPEKRREINRKFHEDNPGYGKEWERRNPDKVIARRARAYAKKKNSPEWKVANTIKVGIYKSLKDQKAGRKWESLVGYTVDELIAHLEKCFLPGMSWGNYGNDGWHIDHIIPRSVFNYEKPEDIDFQKCWALSNLRPLWAADNIRKGAQLDAPFQPSLAIPANDNTNPMKIGKT